MSRAQKILELALQQPLLFLESPEPGNSAVQEHTGKITSYNADEENNVASKKEPSKECDIVTEDSVEGDEVSGSKNIINTSQAEEIKHRNITEDEYYNIGDITEDEGTEFTAEIVESINGTSEAEDPEYQPTADRNSEGENFDNVKHLRRKRAKRNHVKEDNWKREQNKRRRELGDCYDGKKCIDGEWKYNIPKQQRVLKERCSCKISIKNQNTARRPTLKCYLLSDEDRKLAFDNFWKLTWGEKKLFVKLNMRSNESQRHRDRKEEEKSRRVNSFNYYLRKENEPIKVCKKMFLNTLSIGEWTARSWKIGDKQEDDAERGLHTTAEKNEGNVADRNEEPSQDKKRRRLDVKRIECLKLFFETLPKMESHYCRSTSQKLYLEPEWKSKQELYELYSEDWCTERNVQPFSITYFDHYFNDMNLSLFKRKKDECDLCVAKNMNNVLEEEYLMHQQKKKEAREEKQKDKESNSNKVYTMDLQAVLLCPKSNVSSLYYKTKLAVHNFTIYDIKTHAGYCFLWSEIEGTVGANEFSSIICSFAETQLSHLEPGEELIFYSDGCTGQNRNAILSSALLNFAVYHKIHVVQKYLERGHTQMEADSIHSCIERQLKNKVINVPADYVDIVKKSRKRPEPYRVEYLEHDFFRNFSSIQYVPSIRSGKKAGDPTVTDLRALRYNPDGTIQFKLRHTENWQLLTIRGNKKIPLGILLNDIPTVYKEKLKIKKEKFDHLQALKTTMLSDYHAFYNNLKHL